MEVLQLAANINLFLDGFIFTKNLLDKTTYAKLSTIPFRVLKTDLYWRPIYH
jgi:hypothetical protein